MLLLSFPCLHNPEKFWDKQVSSFFLGAINSKDRDLSQDSCIEHLYSEKGREFRHSCIYVSCLESSRSCFGCSFRCPSLLHSQGPELRLERCSGCDHPQLRQPCCAEVQGQAVCVCVCPCPARRQPPPLKGGKDSWGIFFFYFFTKSWGSVCMGRGCEEGEIV